jgi:hypothetical protein
VGAAGTVEGTAIPDGIEYALSPDAFVDFTETEYGIPFVRPLIVQPTVPESAVVHELTGEPVLRGTM